MLTDSEFVNIFSQDIGEDYRNAKSYVNDVPTQTLLHVRGICHKLTQIAAESHQISFNSPNLFDRIEQLNEARAITARVARKLHKLRADGNRGAHPEKFHLTLEQLEILAKKSIADLVAVIEILFVTLGKGTLPPYQFMPFDAIAGRELCYRAVMDADPDAQYLVAMSLKAKALLLQEQRLALDEQELVTTNTSSGGIPDKLSQDIDAAFSQAAYWFKAASAQQNQALFEYGVCLIHGYGVAPQPAKGETVIQQAASLGVPEAMALLGYFYLVGSENFTQNQAQAEHYLQQAAAQDIAEAMANLGVWFYQQQQFESAFLWIHKAAQTGYPHSQYHLALMLAAGEGCKQDHGASDTWMREAAVHGQLDAMLAVATARLDQLAENSADDDKLSLKDIEFYLQQAIKYGHSVAAMIQLSIALADGTLGRIDVVGAAALLNMADKRASAREQEVIWPLWQSLLTQVEQVIGLTDNNEELVALYRAQELLQLPLMADGDEN